MENENSSTDKSKERAYTQYLNRDMAYMSALQTASVTTGFEIDKLLLLISTMLIGFNWTILSSDFSLIFNWISIVSAFVCMVLIIKTFDMQKKYISLLINEDPSESKINSKLKNIDFLTRVMLFISIFALITGAAFTTKNTQPPILIKINENGSVAYILVSPTTQNVVGFTGTKIKEASKGGR